MGRHFNVLNTGETELFLYFESGLDPRLWEYEDGYKVELDEDGGAVHTATGADRGGLTLPCLSWSLPRFAQVATELASKGSEHGPPGSSARAVALDTISVTRYYLNR